MSDEKEPEKLSKEELDKVNGGYSVWIGGSVIADNANVDGVRK